MTKTKLVILLGIVIALGVLFYPKSYDRAGGLTASPFADKKTCVGVRYDYYPKGCADCFATRYCIGIPIAK